MPEAIHAVAAYRHATSLGVRVALRRIAKPHAVAAIVRRRDAPAARWRGDASTARWRSAIHPRSEAAGGNSQRQSSAAYDFNQSFQGFLTISSNNYQVSPGVRHGTSCVLCVDNNSPRSRKVPPFVPTVKARLTAEKNIGHLRIRSGHSVPSFLIELHV